MQILRPRIGGSKIPKIPVQNDDVRLGLVRRIVLGTDIDRGFLVHKLLPEHPQQPGEYHRQSVHMRPVLAHLVDQFSLDQFQVLLVQQSRSVEACALLPSPALARRVARGGRGRNFNQGAWHGYWLHSIGSRSAEFTAVLQRRTPSAHRVHILPETLGADSEMWGCTNLRPISKSAFC